MSKRNFLLLAALALLLAPGGCIFSPEDGEDIDKPPVAGLLFPGSETQLMNNFRLVYEEMDFNGYEKMLHRDFLTLLQPETQQEFPDVGPTLDLAEEIHIARRMFAGDPVTNPLGETVPGISTISFQTFEQQGTWATSSSNDVIPNARFALFKVTFLFDRPGFSQLKVEGQIKFYAAGRDSFHNGANRTYWQMIGQQDLTDAGPPPPAPF